MAASMRYCVAKSVRLFSMRNHVNASLVGCRSLSCGLHNRKFPRNSSPSSLHDVEMKRYTSLLQSNYVPTTQSWSNFHRNFSSSQILYDAANDSSIPGLSASEAGAGTTDLSGVVSGDDIGASELLTSAQSLLEPIKEVPFAELGLNNYSPAGLVEALLELLHVSGGLPWWGAICLATVTVKLVMFPIVIKNQRLTARMSNAMPKLQELQAKLSEAKKGGTQMEEMAAMNKVQQYMQKNDINPLKSVGFAFLQIPVFVSVFTAIRQMSMLPVESMKVGGFAWFTDLTISDPYYALPIISCGCICATIALGTMEGVSNPTVEKYMKYFMIMPFLLFPFIATFPQGVFMYFITTNAFTVCQVGLLKIPAVRQYFQIPVRKKHPPKPVGETNKTNKKGFFADLKKGWEDTKIEHERNERVKAHQRRLKDAGIGPIPQTFKYDPTKPQPAPTRASSDGPRKIRKKIR